MQIRISKNVFPRSREVRVGDSAWPTMLYTTPYISLPHGEKLFFDGFIPGIYGREASFFKKFFESDGIQDLLEEANEWDGCWAIVYLTQNGSTYCFTDPLGKKQLYYNTKGEICSSITPLVNDGSSFDDLYLGAVQKWGYNVDDLTPYTNIKRIMPGKCQLFIGGVPQSPFAGNYFDFRWNAKLDDTGFRALISRSVEEYTKGVDEVASIGVLLSGGIDSSIIAFELLRLKKANRIPPSVKLNFYTINNKEDAPFVEIFAKEFNIKVKTLSYDIYNTDLNKALLINETPVDLGSMIPNQKMFEAIPDTILFTGDGPDEMFGGYRRIDEYDSQKSDIFHELSFYHLPRLEKAACYYHKDLRCPWLSYDIVRYALSLPFEERKHKSCIKKAYRGLIPDEIIDRPKLPLKNDKLREDPIGYRRELVKYFTTKK